LYSQGPMFGPNSCHCN